MLCRSWNKWTKISHHQELRVVGRSVARGFCKKMFHNVFLSPLACSLLLNGNRPLQITNTSERSKFRSSPSSSANNPFSPPDTSCCTQVVVEANIPHTDAHVPTEWTMWATHFSFAEPPPAQFGRSAPHPSCCPTFGTPWWSFPTPTPGC